MFLNHLISNSLESLMSASKTEFKAMLAALSLQCEHGMSKDGMIKNVSNAMLDVFGDTLNRVLALIEEEERNEGVIWFVSACPSSLNDGV